MKDEGEKNINKLHWQDREGRTPVEPSRWGQDHWSLLAYVGARQGHGGLIDWNLVTLSRRNWPSLYATRNPYADADGGDSADMYPLRLRGGEVLPGHCEADALMDLAMHDVVVVTMPPPAEDAGYFLMPDGKRRIPGVYWDDWTDQQEMERALMLYAKFSLTDLGWDLKLELDRHRALPSPDSDWSKFRSAWADGYESPGASSRAD